MTRGCYQTGTGMARLVNKKCVNYSTQMTCSNASISYIIVITKLIASYFLLKEAKSWKNYNCRS